MRLLSIDKCKQCTYIYPSWFNMYCWHPTIRAQFGEFSKKLPDYGSLIPNFCPLEIVKTTD